MQGNSHRLVRVLEDLDVSLTQVKLLDALAGSKADPSLKGLSEFVGCSMPNASRSVEGLQRRGWVERREDAEDRRVKRLRITPEGRDVINSVNTARLEGIEAFAAGLSPSQRTALHDAITALPHAKDSR